jgi:capsular polysaccharide transport system permease protein
MSVAEQGNHGRLSTRLADAWSGLKQSLLSLTLFRQTVRLIFIAAILAMSYWLAIASNRYVSAANVIIQQTEAISRPSFDISSMLGVAGIGGANRPDQLLLREYLLSVDILKKLDAALDLRSHYSDWRRDPVSRMWFKDASMEWFHRHYLSRVSVDYDDFAGVLRIRVQAYDPETAQAIARMLVQEGERYMNQIGHELAEVQVTFLTNQVDLAQQRFLQASQALLNYQDRKGLVSPQATAESINTIIAKLEAQRTDLETQLASLPTTLVKNHPNILMLKQSIEAVERQIAQEKAKLASTSGNTLNYTVEEFERLKMEVTFTQDIYKTALLALETGRMDATRTLKKVSVLQAPSLPEYPMEPGRIYNTVVTLLIAAMLAGIVKLLEGIVRDHVD